MSKSKLNFKSHQLKVEVKDDGHGHEYIELDVFTSHYIHFVKSKAFALVTPSYDSLPFEAYIIPLTSDVLQDSSLLNELQTRATEGLPVFSLPSLALNVYAIRLEVKGAFDDGDYSKGSSVTLASGILDTNSIRTWNSWRYVPMPWLEDIWRKCGLNPKVYEVDLCSIIKHRDFEVNFSKISMFRIGKARDEKQALLLTVCMLYNYWERNKVTLAQRAFHIECLRFSYRNVSGNLSSWYGEAWCKPMSRSVAVQHVKYMCGEASRYYEKHREEIEHLIPHYRTYTSKLWLHSSFDDEQTAKYIEKLRQEDKLRFSEAENA